LSLFYFFFLSADAKASPKETKPNRSKASAYPVPRNREKTLKIIMIE